MEVQIFKSKFGDWDIIEEHLDESDLRKVLEDDKYDIGLYRIDEHREIWYSKHLVPDRNLVEISSVVMSESGSGVVISDRYTASLYHKVIEEFDQTQKTGSNPWDGAWSSVKPWELGLEWEHKIDPHPDSLEHIVDTLENSAFENTYSLYRVIQGGEIVRYARYREFGNLGNPVFYVYYQKPIGTGNLGDDSYDTVVRYNTLEKFLPKNAYYDHMVKPPPFLPEEGNEWAWFTLWEVDVVKDIENIQRVMGRELRYKDGFWYLSN